MADNTKLVTDELVAQVAERLAAAGEKVTNRAVWSAIGGGSMTTISSALRRWREQQELQPEPAVQRRTAPAEVVELAVRMAEQLAESTWDTSQAMRDSEIDELTNSMNDRVKKAQNEREAVLVELETTLEELKTAKDFGEAQRVAALKATDQVDLLNEDLIETRRRLAVQQHAAETAQAALEEARARISDLMGLNDKERSERAVVSNRAFQAEQDLARVTAEEKAQRTRADDLAARLVRAEQHAEVLDQRIQAIEGEIKAALRDAGDQRTAAEAARGEAAEARHAAQVAEAARVAAEEAATELHARLAALEAKDDELTELAKPLGAVDDSHR